MQHSTTRCAYPEDSSCADGGVRVSHVNGSLIASPMSMVSLLPPRVTVLSAVETIRRTSGTKHERCKVHNGLTRDRVAQGPPSQSPVPSPGGQPSHPRYHSDGF
jgi:hypothetical protein